VLRVLQEGEVERLGSSRTIKVDVRVIAATNKDLEEEIAQGRFREDLYFRLSVIPIYVPPLRERVEDIPALVQHFVSQFSREHNRRPARFSPGALDMLRRARWRGNIRELGNVIERLLIMSDRDTIEAEDVRQVVRLDGGRAVAPATSATPDVASSAVATAAEEPAPSIQASGPKPATLREFKEWSERAFLVEKLRELNWNISKTAEVVDTPRSNLYKKLEQYNIRQETDG
jgi:two-component system nitrogen regulation response regulator NtrX